MPDVEKLAKELGFEQVALIEPDMVITSEALAASCNPQACKRYASCWTCPPGAGSFADIQDHIRTKDAGVLVQTVRDDVDFYEDWEKLGDIRHLHNERLDKLAETLKPAYAGVLEFSTGGCDVCSACSYPDAPCRKPDNQRLSLSAHGVSVNATCQNAKLDYSFQNGRIRYVGMILWNA